MAPGRMFYRSRWENLLLSVRRLRRRPEVSLRLPPVRRMDLSTLRNTVLSAITLVLLVHLFLGQATVVRGQSMQPNIRPDERLIMERLSFYFRKPRHNEIVILAMPESAALMVKRVVGLPGDTLVIQEGHVFLNGNEVAPAYDTAPRWRVFVGGNEVKAPSRFGESHSSYGPITLAEDSYFVLGDNRDNSKDSRFFGPVPRKVIKGRVWMRFWPLARFAVFE